MSIALIDADSIYFKGAMVAKKKSDIRNYINSEMRRIEAACFYPALTYVAIKGKNNFRKELYSDYKAQRKYDYDDRTREFLNYGHNLMLEKYDAVQADGMEADDLVCIWAYEAREAEIQYTIVGMDKDLLQIPGNHYNFNKQEFTFVDDDTAHYNLMVQCLTGDSSDNIPGIKGIGPKKAERILRDVHPDLMWDTVRGVWRDNSMADPKLSRRLLEMIKSWEEYDAIREQISGKTSKCKQDVLPEQEQDERVSGVSE